MCVYMVLKIGRISATPCPEASTFLYRHTLEGRYRGAGFLPLGTWTLEEHLRPALGTSWDTLISLKA
jgi:hypothetical protein